MEIYFVTSNQGKVQSIQRDLDKFKISAVQYLIDLIEPRSSDVQEITQAKIKLNKPMLKSINLLSLWMLDFTLIH